MLNERQAIEASYKRLIRGAAVSVCCFVALMLSCAGAAWALVALGEWGLAAWSGLLAVACAVYVHVEVGTLRILEAQRDMHLEQLMPRHDLQRPLDYPDERSRSIDYIRLDERRDH